MHGGLSGLTSKGSSSDWTVFGPGVQGDQPGQPYYDYNSYHGIGAYGKLKAGDTAMNPEYARSHYHIKPGDTYISDKDHKEHRWMDKTGSKNFQNEDVYTPKVTMNYQIQVLDAQGVKRVLDEHGDLIASRLKDIHSDWLSRTAAV